MSSDGHRRHRFDIGGSVLSVVEDGQGPAILLGHGYLWDWSMWRPQVPALSRTCRVVIPELWGHGRSGPLPPDIRSPADLARPMLELLDRLDIDRCVVIGASVGGMWGAHLAAAAPDRVAGLVLMNSYLGQEPAEKRLAYQAMLNRVEATGRVEDGIADAIMPLFFAADVATRDPSLPLRLRRHLDGFSAEALRRSIVPLGRAIFNRPNGLDALMRVAAPTLLIAGADDRARPPAESRIMANLIRAELVEIRQCGHTATLERPAAVTDALLAFLDRVGWGAPGPSTASIGPSDGTGDGDRNHPPAANRPRTRSTGSRG